MLMAVNACAPLWLEQWSSPVAYGGGISQKTALRPPNLGGERPVVEQADLGEQGVRLEQGLGSEGKAQSGNERQRGNNEEGWTRPRQ